MRYYTITGALSISITIALVLFAGETTSKAVESKTTPPAAPRVYLATSTVPVAVSGIVQAADTATIYAATAGVVRSLPYQEGSVVAAQALLVEQSGPVENARITQAEAERRLAETQRALDTEVTQVTEDVAVQNARTADALLDLRGKSNQERMTEATTALGTGVTAAMDPILSAVDFVNNNRSLVTSEGRESYDEVLQLVYGRTPTYFTSILGPRPPDGFQGLVALSQVATTSVEAAATAGTRTVTILRTLNDVLATAEDGVFNRREATPETVKATYLAQSEAVAQAQASIEGLLAALQQTVDAARDAEVVQFDAATTAHLDRVGAATRTRYADVLTARTTALQSATVAVATAERSLGLVRAPFAGMVTELLISEGEYATPGTPLMRLVGTGVTEVTVTVPRALGTNLRTGQTFMVGDEVVGYVDRFAPRASGQSYQVVITLTAEQFTSGQTIRGSIALDQTETIFRVPRAYVHFDSAGSFVRSHTGATSRVSIVYDNGSDLFVTVHAPFTGALDAVNRVQF